MLRTQRDRSALTWPQARLQSVGDPIRCVTRFRFRSGSLNLIAGRLGHDHLEPIGTVHELPYRMSSACLDSDSKDSWGILETQCFQDIYGFTIGICHGIWQRDPVGRLSGSVSLCFHRAAGARLDSRTAGVAGWERVANPRRRFSQVARLRTNRLLQADPSPGVGSMLAQVVFLPVIYSGPRPMGCRGVEPSSGGAFSGRPGASRSPSPERDSGPAGCGRSAPRAPSSELGHRHGGPVKPWIARRPAGVAG